MDASDSFWDGRRITLTENTRKNIIKKGQAMDAEAYLQNQGYGLRGKEALKELVASGFNPDTFAQVEGSHTSLGVSAITLLEKNASAEDRVNAMLMLGQLSYTNIYDAGSGEYLTLDEQQKEQTATPAEVPSQSPIDQIGREEFVKEEQERSAPEQFYGEAPRRKAPIMAMASQVPRQQIQPQFQRFQTRKKQAPARMPAREQRFEAAPISQPQQQSSAPSGISRFSVANKTSTMASGGAVSGGMGKFAVGGRIQNVSRVQPVNQTKGSMVAGSMSRFVMGKKKQ